jgi:hypothetical protein
MMASAIISDTIPCDRLCVNEGNDAPVPVIAEPKEEKTNIQPQQVEAWKNKSRETIEPLTTANIR